MTKRGDGSIDPEKLKALFKAESAASGEAAEIRADFNKDKQAAIEVLGLHPRAFTMCCTIARMPQVKRLALLDALDNYREILGLDDAPQGELETLARDLTKDGTTVTMLRGAGR